MVETVGVKTVGDKPEQPDNELTGAELGYLTMNYEEHAEHARKHEELRGTSTNALIALMAGAFAFAAADKVQGSMLIAGVVIAVASLFGWILSKKHFERYEYRVNYWYIFGHNSNVL